MKKRKSITLILFLSGLTAAVVLAGANLKTERYYNYDDLLKTAETKGFVRVIVKLDVPGIEQLTAGSNRFQTGRTDMSYIQEAFDVDLELESAIATSADQVLYKLNGKIYKINHTFSTIPYLAVDLSPEALVLIRNLPEVISITEDRLTPLPKNWKENAGEDSASPQLLDSHKIVGADVAWNMGFTGTGWKVAILDSGIRRTHEMFTGKTIVEQCYSLLKDCPNGNSSMSGSGAAAHIMSGESHGTHVAGIAAGNNQNQMFGVAKDAGIIAIQVFSYIAAWNDIGSYNSDQIKGLEFVYSKRNRHKIAAANLSLGGVTQYHNNCDSENSAMKAAISNLKAVGIATAIAAGNQEGSEDPCDGIAEPACISSCIAVGASKKTDTHADFSYFSENLLDLFAPGKNIQSAVTSSNSAYSSWNGTSMATPHVTGAWAVLKQFRPNISVNDALKVLKNEGFGVTNFCTGTKKPRIDVGASIVSLLSLAPPMNFSGTQQVNRSLLMNEYINILTWEANPQNAQNNQDVTKYRIYTVDGAGSLTLLIEVDSSTLSYQHRMVNRGTTYEYAVKSVNNNGQDSIAAFSTVNPL